MIVRNIPLDWMFKIMYSVFFFFILIFIIWLHAKVSSNWRNCWWKKVKNEKLFKTSKQLFQGLFCYVYIIQIKLLIIGNKNTNFHYHKLEQTLKNSLWENLAYLSPLQFSLRYFIDLVEGKQLAKLHIINVYMSNSMHAMFRMDVYT